MQLHIAGGLMDSRFLNACRFIGNKVQGVAEQMGVYNEDDVQALVNEVRYGKGKG